jgi:hypothetical protein
MPLQALTRDDDPRQRQRVDEALRAAARDRDAHTLMKAYETAADLASADGNADAAAFFLTHAYVWALVAGSGAADRLAARLQALGRPDVDEVPW